MTRLYVDLICEKCGDKHGVTNARTILGSKPITDGLCMWCEYEEKKEERGKRNE